MVQIPRWQVILIVVVLLAGLVFAVPNLMKRETTEALPGWVPSDQINLGLDLQGGSYLLLEADIDNVIREQVENLIDSTRAALRRAKIGYTGLGVGASRFGARVALDLVDGLETERTELEMVRRKPMPFPPEPLRSIAIQTTRRAIARSDRTGKPGLLLRALDRFGVGFDS